MEAYWKKIPDPRIKQCFLRKVPKDFKEEYERNTDKLFERLRRKPSFLRKLLNKFF